MAGEASGGLFSSLKTLASTLLGIVHTRVELFSTEVEEEIERLKLQLLFSAVTFFFLALGVLFASALLVVAFWESNRLLVLGLLALLYFLLGGLFWVASRRLSEQKPKLFAASLAELGKDRNGLDSPDEP